MDTDEKYGADVLRPLNRTPAAPSTVDVMRAVADGERQRRTVRQVSSGAVVAVTVLMLVGGWVVLRPQHQPMSVGALPTTVSPTATSTVGPTLCTLSRLGVPAGQPPKSVVTGGDPTGRYILGRSYPGGASHSVLIWDNGQVRALAMAGEDQELHDITSAGVAVGTSYVKTEQTAAWVYQNGTFTRLAGGVAEANAINEKGVIVGSVNGKPAKWATPQSQPTMLALPGAGYTGYAAGIDEDGTIVGRLNAGPDKPDLGYVWKPDGTISQLTVPVLQGKAASTFTADAIRDGWVVGWVALDEGDARYIGTARWNLRTGEHSTSVDPQLVEAVNGLGWVVGESGSHAELKAGGTVVRLPDLGSTEIPVINIPYTISDDGKVLAGQVQLANGEPVAVRWDCH